MASFRKLTRCGVHQLIKKREKDPDRLELVIADAFAWESYAEITDRGLLDDVPKLPWDQSQS